ncbi:hypothetical protein BpHYR1_032206 [Brachionus plicatilis]|uniref:RNA-directed DNA polymerase from mobile element jockey-like n=1 Tax=Brachionus plicatilis TaxID=10195 RepID=A0A3M7Q636_BRAPC|nr:hypothetical protein BpHYR1_032206 [Brachionus plicatilis]
MSPEKCSYTVFRRNLSGGKISFEKNIKFLGVTFDESLSFNALGKEIENKLDELAERYVRNALENSVDVVVQLITDQLSVKSRRPNLESFKTREN